MRATTTTHLEFEPLDLVAGLAALMPRPRINLVTRPIRRGGVM